METQEYSSRQFMIFNVSELPLIDFTQVLETSADTVRRSVDGTKTFVKWDGDTPQCVLDLATKEGPFTYEEMLIILATLEWTPAYIPPTIYNVDTVDNIVTTNNQTEPL